MRIRRRLAVLAASAMAAAAILAGCQPGTAAPGPPTTTEASPTPPPPPPPPVIDERLTARGWELAWYDEFSGDRLDESRWTVLNRSTFGDGNLEEACLLGENVEVRDGALVITARRADPPRHCGASDARFPNGRPYTSGLVETKEKASFRYGRFEVSAKVPMQPGSSKGLWPAFWMRPDDRGIGELDVMEMIGTGPHDTAPHAVVQTIHYDYAGTHPQEGAAHPVPEGFEQDFHLFAVEWGPGVIRWYVDDVLTFVRTSETTPWLDEAFGREFFLRLNLAVGGRWPGSPDDATAFPAEFVVDHVRVYRR